MSGKGRVEMQRNRMGRTIASRRTIWRRQWLDDGMMEAGQAMYGTVETWIGANGSEANRCSNTSIRYIVLHIAAQWEDAVYTIDW
jgi:hypothetical protein